MLSTEPLVLGERGRRRLPPQYSAHGEYKASIKLVAFREHSEELQRQQRRHFASQSTPSAELVRKQKSCVLSQACTGGFDVPPFDISASVSTYKPADALCDNCRTVETKGESALRTAQRN
jgi:hypothetical protein